MLRVPDDMGNYFGLIASGSRRAVDKALDGFVDRDDLERDFWSEYRKRVRSALKQKGDKKGLIEFRDLESFAEKLPAMIEAAVTRACKQLPIAGPVPSIDVQAGEGQRSEKTERSIVKFPLLDNLRWNEVTMEISEDTVRITARRRFEIYEFSQIGFEDRRRANHAHPDQLWHVLLMLAKGNGEINWQSKAGQVQKGKIKTAIKRLRRRLMAIMQIDDDPFHPYSSRKAYVAKFTIVEGPCQSSTKPRG